MGTGSWHFSVSVHVCACVSDSVTARLIGSWVEQEGRRSGWEVEWPASKGMYSVRLNKCSGSENGQYLAIGGQLCATWQQGQKARGSLSLQHPQPVFIPHNVKSTWCIKVSSGQQNLIIYFFDIVCMCTADNFINLSLWFDSVTSPKTVSSLIEMRKNKAQVVTTKKSRDFKRHAGQFLFLAQLLLRNPSRCTHTSIWEKWLRTNHFLFYSFI